MYSCLFFSFFLIYFFNQYAHLNLCNSLAAKLTAQQEQHVERVRALKEEKDYQEGQYTAMLNEMSEKIQQLEDAANLSHESHDGEER